MDPKEQQLKELEKSLTEELEGKAAAEKSSAASTASSAAISTATVPTPTDPNAGIFGFTYSPVDVLDEADKESSSVGSDMMNELLTREDPKFMEKIQAMQQELKADFKEDDPTKPAAAAHPFANTKDKTPQGLHPKGFVASRKAIIVESLKFRMRNLKADRVKTRLLRSLKNTKAFLSALFKEIGSSLSHFKAVSKKKKFMALGIPICIALAVLSLMFKPSALKLKGAHTLTSFGKVADHNSEIEADTEYAKFSFSEDTSDFLASIGKMVTQLRPSSLSSKKPMIAFELILEGTSREVSIEIKDRENSMKDTIQRTVESMAYDDFVTVGGKQKFKILAKTELNKLLTTGSVKAVYFKTLILKP